VNETIRAKHSNGISPKLTAAKCYKCEEYDHIAANCSSPVRIAILSESPTENLESGFEEIAYQPNEEVDDDPISIKKIMMLNSTIFDTHLQLICLCH